MKFSLPKPKCAKYWPEPNEQSDSNDCSELYDKINVTFLNENKHGNDYLLREFLITETTSKISRKLFQFQYLAWSGERQACMKNKIFSL